MKWTTGGAIALGALIAMGANDISAQQANQARNRGAFRQRSGVEAIMQMRDRLELTEGQLTALEALRSESIQGRNAAMAELAELRSQLAAGQIQRSEMMAFMEHRREASAGVAVQRRADIDGILDDTQREALQTRAQAGRRGQANARRGRSGMRGRPNARGARTGMRGARGGRPGMSGRGSMRGGRGFRGQGRGGPPGEAPGVPQDPGGRGGS